MKNESLDRGTATPSSCNPYGLTAAGADYFCGLSRLVPSIPDSEGAVND